MTYNYSALTSSTLFWIFVILGVGYAAILVIMYLFQSAFVYFPSRTLTATPEMLGLEYSEVHVRTSDDIGLHGWYIPADESRGTLLFFHGNAGNISGRLESIEQFHSLGLNVFIFDYRGYGKSEGSPSEAGTYRDAEAVWRHLTEVREESPDRIVLFGRSLGGGVASWLASEVEAGALVLESTFTSAVDLAGEIYPFLPVRWLMHIRYPAIDYLEEVTYPVMVAHSEGDDVVPYHHGQALYEAANEPKFWMEMQGQHNDGFIVTGSAYVTSWDRFLQESLR